jgi:hypothetical protein
LVKHKTENLEYNGALLQSQIFQRRHGGIEETWRGKGDMKDKRDMKDKEGMRR